MTATFKPNSPGQPTKLDAELEGRIYFAVRKVLVPNQIAKLAGTHADNLHNWLGFGERDIKAGNDNTQFAQFFLKFHQLRAERANELLEKLEACPKIYQPLIWMLEKCFREDFGHESDEMRELKAMFFKIMEARGLNYDDMKNGGEL